MTRSGTQYLPQGDIALLHVPGMLIGHRGRPGLFKNGCSPFTSDKWELLPSNRKLKPSSPISGLAAMVGNGQHLHQAVGISVNKVKVKDLEHGTTDVWGKNDACAIWRCANPFQGVEEFAVVTTAQSRLNVFVVSDLLFVFFGGRGVEPKTHFKSA